MSTATDFPHPLEISASGCRQLLLFLTKNIKHLKTRLSDRQWDDISLYLHDAMERITLWNEDKDEQDEPCTKIWLYDLIRVEILACRYHPLLDSLHRQSRHTARYFTLANISLHQDLFLRKSLPLDMNQHLEVAALSLQQAFEYWLKFQHQGLTREEILYSASKWLVPGGIRHLVHLCFFFYTPQQDRDYTLYVAIHLATVGLWLGRTFAQFWNDTSCGLQLYIIHNNLQNMLIMPKAAGHVWAELNQFFMLLGSNREAPCASCQRPASSRCSQCTINYYCSKRCQRRHWPTHRLECKAHQQTKSQHLFTDTSYRRFFRYLQFYRTTMVSPAHLRGVHVLCVSHQGPCQTRLDLNPHLRYFSLLDLPSSKKQYCCWRCELSMFQYATESCIKTYKIPFVMQDYTGVMLAIDEVYRQQEANQLDPVLKRLPILVQFLNQVGLYSWAVYMV